MPLKLHICVPVTYSKSPSDSMFFAMPLWIPVLIFKFFVNWLSSPRQAFVLWCFNPWPCSPQNVLSTSRSLPVLVRPFFLAALVFFSTWVEGVFQTGHVKGGLALRVILFDSYMHFFFHCIWGSSGLESSQSRGMQAVYSGLINMRPLHVLFAWLAFESICFCVLTYVRTGHRPSPRSRRRSSWGRDCRWHTDCRLNRMGCYGF